MKPVIIGSDPSSELVITLKDVRLTEFIAGYVKCDNSVMEVNPTLSLMLSHEVTAPFLDEHAPEGTAKIRHLIRLPWRRSELEFGLSDVPFRFPLRTRRLPDKVSLLIMLEVDTTTAMGQSGTKMVGVASVPLQKLQTGNVGEVEIVNRPAIAAGYGKEFWLKGILHLDSVEVEIPRTAEYVHDSVGEDDYLQSVCDKLTDRYYDTVNGCVSLRKDLASVHTPFYASGTVPSNPHHEKDVPMIPSSLGFDRRPPDDYQFEPHLIDSLLTAALDQCHLTEERFLDPQSGKDRARAVECAHLVVTLFPICERYGFDDAYKFRDDLGTSVPPWEKHQEKKRDQEAPRYSLLAPSSRLVPRHTGPLRIDTRHKHIYTHEEVEVEEFETESRPYVVPSAKKRHYGNMDPKYYGGTDELHVPMMGGESIMDCEDGAFYARKLIESMDHVIANAESAEQKARFEGLQKIYDHYIYARTVNWCHGDVCHILTVGFEKHGFYEGLLQGIAVAQFASTVHGDSKDELDRLAANVRRQLDKVATKPDTFAYPSMVALETTSKSDSRLDGVPAPTKRDILCKLDVKLQMMLKDSPNMQAQWQFTMQTRDIDSQDNMCRFTKWPERNPLFEFYNYITAVEVAHDLGFQNPDVAWMSFLAMENRGQDPRNYLSKEGKPVYGASVQRMALEGYALLPAMAVSTEQRRAVEELMRADIPMAFFTGKTRVGIDVITKQPRHDVFIPMSLQEADTALRQKLCEWLVTTDYHVAEGMVPLRFYVVEELFSSTHLEEFRRGIDRIRHTGVFHGLDYDIISLTTNTESAVDAVNGERVSRGDSALSYTRSRTLIYCISVYCTDIVHSS